MAAALEVCLNFLLVSVYSMDQSESDPGSEKKLGPQTPPSKKPKRQCHFDASWMKEFEGIRRSSKGKQISVVKGCGLCPQT